MKPAVQPPKPLAVREQVAKLVADLDREDLVVLLTELAQRQPELLTVLRTQIAPQTRSRKTKSHRRKPVDAEAYRRRVIGILHSLDGMRPSETYWHVRDLVEKLSEAKETTDELLARGDAENALRLLVILLEESCEGIELIDDSDGYLGSFVGKLGEPLARAARHAKLSGVERERLIRKLTKVGEYLAGYDMQELVDEAIQVAKSQKHVTAKRSNHEPR